MNFNYKNRRSDFLPSRPSPKEVHEAIRLNNAKITGKTNLLDVSSLRQGQILKGSIIDLRFNQVKLMVEPDKLILLAGLSGEVPLEIGQETQFLVTKDSSGQLILKHKPEENKTQIQETIEKALTASNLPISDKNAALVQELLNHQLPIDKTTLQLLHKFSARHHDTSPSTLVSMYKHSITINADNISQFESYQQGSHSLVENFNRIINNISTLLEGLEKPSSDQSFSWIMDFPAKLFSTLEGKEETTPIALAEDMPAISSLLSSGQRETLVKNLETLYLGDDLARGNLFNQIREGSAKLNNVLSVLKEITLLEENHSNPRDLHTLISSQEYSKILGEAFHLRWTLPLKKLSKENSIRDLYKLLEEDMEQLSKLEASTTKARENFILKEPTKNLQDNLQFMRELNDIMQYIQLPIQLSNQDAHVDLYVLNKKKALLDKKDSLNIYIQLKMEHLGFLAIKMLMSEKNIQASFQLEDSESSKLIEKYLPELRKSLEVKGYQFNGRIETNEEKVNVFDEILKLDANNEASLRYSFDIRA